ncbi:hypothetical protein E2C01_051792 [Portunus trituberculatus]|uniref:Uncharacterized protein n=1 Tax=Portunus trituberculatus TaxID=210409 RepID=A0A5B7GMP6_PORTR|nr:hypothetical protein [Portunus trituberculatus]
MQQDYQGRHVEGGTVGVVGESFIMSGGGGEVGGGGGGGGGGRDTHPPHPILYISLLTSPKRLELQYIHARLHKVPLYFNLNVSSPCGGGGYGVSCDGSGSGGGGSCDHALQSAILTASPLLGRHGDAQ